MGFFLFLIPSPTSPAMVAGDAKAESGARNHLSQPGASGDVKENGEDFFWHLNGENMGKDHIIYGRLYGRLLYIIVIHIISWYFLWSYWILGAHGHMALQIVLLSVSGFLPCFFINRILWSDVDDAFPVGWIGQVMRALTSSQLWEKSLDLLAGRNESGSWDPIRPLDPVGSSSQGRNRHPFHFFIFHLLHRLRYECNLIWHV